MSAPARDRDDAFSHATTTRMAAPEALGPQLRDDCGRLRRAVLFAVHTTHGPLWTVATEYARDGRPEALVDLHSYPPEDRSLAIRDWADLVLDHVFCEECREGDTPACCPQDFGPCRRRA